MGDSSDVHEGTDDLESEGAESTLYELCEDFDHMNVHEKLLRGIYDFGSVKHSALRRAAVIPCVSCKDIDPTSSDGKNLTISDLLQQVDMSIRDCQVLILALTRKLAVQLQIAIMSYTEHMKVISYSCMGGTNVREDASNLKAGVHVVVGTPGRVYDMIKRRGLCTSNIKLLVIEEDVKLSSNDMKKQIQNIFKMLPAAVEVTLLSDIMLPDDFKFSGNLNDYGAENGQHATIKSVKTKNKHKNDEYTISNWILEKSCQVCIKKIKGQKVIDIREYHEENGKFSPGRKGISLSVKQWTKLVTLTKEINQVIEQN